jgi:hypothetical protein
LQYILSIFPILSDVLRQAEDLAFVLANQIAKGPRIAGAGLQNLFRFLNLDWTALGWCH